MFKIKAKDLKIPLKDMSTAALQRGIAVWLAGGDDAAAKATEKAQEKAARKAVDDQKAA
jgi:hypothetical protein